MIIEKNESKVLAKQRKCRFYRKNVIHIKGGITINVKVSVKNVMYVQTIIFGILLNVVLKRENI